MVCDSMEGLLSDCYQSSLMATEKDHILTPLDLFDWTSKIYAIFILVTLVQKK